MQGPRGDQAEVAFVESMEDLRVRGRGGGQPKTKPSDVKIKQHPGKCGDYWIMDQALLVHDALKTRQRTIRSSFPESVSLRVHRALSWLARAEQEPEDPDARFIFLWISFNAAYASELEDRQEWDERGVLLRFLAQLIEVDPSKLLYNIVWEEFSNSIRLLIDNKYVFQPFWDYANRRITEEEWTQRFERSKAKAHRALGKMDTKDVLAVTFDRLYTLRNQLIHGGATWNSAVNRDQVTDSAHLLGRIVPTIIHLMMESPDKFWRDACYPVVD